MNAEFINLLNVLDVNWTTPREVLGVLPVMLFWVFGSTPNTAIPLTVVGVMSQCQFLTGLGVLPKVLY